MTMSEDICHGVRSALIICHFDRNHFDGDLSLISNRTLSCFYGVK